MKSEIPHYVIKKNLQKSAFTGIYFEVPQKDLAFVCRKITGLSDYTLEYVDNDYQDELLDKTYNKGRMALLHYNGVANFISFSNPDIGGRNSSIQSVPTAFNIFYAAPYKKKKLYYYFLNVSDAVCTDYQVLIYRLMKTIGFEFLNTPCKLSNVIIPFSSIDDIILNRNVNTKRNRSNNSTFITKNSSSEIEVYGKTYGANKYETSLICYSLSHLCPSNERIILYEVSEGDLKTLPQSSQKVINLMGNIEVFPTDITLEKRLFERGNSLRSPNYLFNLFNKLGGKHCALCNCDIPELVQGAHIWPVSSIKQDRALSSDQKLVHAINGDNGVWLCENHHKLFDENYFTFSSSGEVVVKTGIPTNYLNFFSEITTTKCLDAAVLSSDFLWYLQQRNNLVC